MVDLVQSFDVVRDEGEGDNEEALDIMFRQMPQHLVRCRLQPLDGSGPGLEGQVVGEVLETLHHQAHRFLDVGEVGVAGVDE